MRYFYRSVKNLDRGVAEFCDVFQILPNDVSTSSLYHLTDDYTEIVELNFCLIEEIAAEKEKLQEWEYVSDLAFCFSPCIALVSDDELFRRFVKLLTERNMKNDRTILFFDVADVYGEKQSICLKNIKRLKSYGIKISVGGYGKNINLMDVFSDMEFDFFRVSAEYILSSNKSLAMLTDFCNADGIKLIADGVTSISDLRRLKQNGVSLVCGSAASEPVEKIDRNYLNLKPLSAIEREKYAYKFKQDKIMAEQLKLASEGKKLLKMAKHGVIYESGYIIADGNADGRRLNKTPKNERTDVETLIKENKLPKSRAVKLDESGNRIKKGENDSLIESIYSLLANNEVRDKERKILRELEAAKKKARAAEEEKFVISQLEAFIKKTEAEKRALCLYKLIPALKERINYLIELDALALEIEQLELEEKIAFEKKREEEEALKAIEEQARLEAEKARRAEEEKLELERLYAKEKARLEFEYELSLKKAKEAEKLLKQSQEPSLQSKTEEKIVVLPPNAGKVVEAVAFYDEFLPAEIEEEVESAVYAETYIEPDGTLKQEVVKSLSNVAESENGLLSDDLEQSYGKTIEENPLASESDEENSDAFSEYDKKKEKEIKKAEKIKEKVEKHKSKKSRKNSNAELNDMSKNAAVEADTENETLSDEDDALSVVDLVLSELPTETESENTLSSDGDEEVEIAENSERDNDERAEDIADEDIDGDDGEESNYDDSDNEAEARERAIDGGFTIDVGYDDGDGHYNEEKQWVDSDGEVYNGYFDVNGRWIDYGYYDEEDVWHDNGYYDGDLFIPYGYFNDDGDYVKI